GRSNEMFTDFREHAIAVPQLVPRLTNNTFDGPGANEDYGREDFTGNPADRYAFRTPSLRNVALEPAFMHDGAFTSLAAAIRFHLNVVAGLRTYDPARQGLPADLSGDRKSTRLNSSHVAISYAVFCLKKKKTMKYEDDH